MYVHTRERDKRPGFDGVKITFIIINNIKRWDAISRLTALLNSQFYRFFFKLTI